MKIYNQTKTQELTENEVDLTKGYLQYDKLFVAHHEATEEVAEQSHYETIAEYPNGGKDVKKIIDVEYQPAREAYDEYEDIKVFVPYIPAELEEIEKTKLRAWRTTCFAIIDRACWYDCLTTEQKVEVKQFRKDLLDITDSMKRPTVPQCVAEELSKEQ